MLFKNFKHLNEHTLQNFPLGSEAHLLTNTNIVHKDQINGLQKYKCNISNCLAALKHHWREGWKWTSVPEEQQLHLQDWMWKPVSLWILQPEPLWPQVED